MESFFIQCLSENSVKPIRVEERLFFPKAMIVQGSVVLGRLANIEESHPYELPALSNSLSPMAEEKAFKELRTSYIEVLGKTVG